MELGSVMLIKLWFCLYLFQQTLIKVIETNMCSLGHLSLTIMHFVQVKHSKKFFWSILQIGQFNVLRSEKYGHKMQ
jgi:hypothetical protein